MDVVPMHAMRIAILSSVLGLSLVACAGNISGGGGDDDIDIPETCGNGAIDPGEDCDGTEGCSAACTTEAVPRVSMTVDKPTVTTDLLADNAIVVTLTSVDGFSGDVSLAVTASDATNAVISDWSAILSSTTVTVPEGGLATATLALNVPGDALALAGTVKVVATSNNTPVPAEATVNVTANPVATLVFTTQGQLCRYPGFDSANPLRLKVGRQIKIVDGGQLPMTIHFGGGAQGISHQGNPMAVNADYTQTVQGPSGGQLIEFYCHTPGTLNGVNVASDGVNARQNLVTVQ